MASVMKPVIVFVKTIGQGEIVQHRLAVMLNILSILMKENAEIANKILVCKETINSVLGVILNLTN